ncbi:hypothetical protein DFH06DRAFT_1102097, partial [Mycena polygramma]
PVTITAIFSQYKVDPKLYTIIFGESLLNGAVGIISYETLTQFHGTIISSVFKGVGIFPAPSVCPWRLVSPLASRCRSS